MIRKQAVAIPSPTPRPRLAGRRSCAVVLALFLAAQSAAICSAQEPAPAQQPVPDAQPTAPSQDQVQPQNQVTAPAQDQPQNTQQEQPAAVPAAPQPAQNPDQPPAPQKPLGTAAAPYEKPTGVPGSRPAGAVIAPAKQRRVRAILIKVGVVVAAGAAAGAVIALSEGSRSRPQ